MGLFEDRNQMSIKVIMVSYFIICLMVKLVTAIIKVKYQGSHHWQIRIWYYMSKNIPLCQFIMHISIQKLIR